jgi:hypothetical protein
VEFTKCSTCQHSLYSLSLPLTPKFTCLSTSLPTYLPIFLSFLNIPLFLPSISLSHFSLNRLSWNHFPNRLDTFDILPYPLSFYIYLPTLRPNIIPRKNYFPTQRHHAPPHLVLTTTPHTLSLRLTLTLTLKPLQLKIVYPASYRVILPDVESSLNLCLKLNFI